MNSADERIDIGSDVLGSDGHKVGTVAYVVVKAPEFHMTDIVVSTGSLLGRDIVAPMDQVDRVEGGQVHLSLDKAGLEKLPDYVEIHYSQAPENWVPEAGMSYPASGVLWPANTYYPETSDVKVNAPEGTVGIRQGMDVESKDGHKIGHVESIDENPTSGDLTDIVVKHGLIMHHTLRLPIDAVTTIHDDRVTLNLNKDEIDQRFEQSNS